jgi:hypothetical protein
VAIGPVDPSGISKAPGCSGRTNANAVSSAYCRALSTEHEGQVTMSAIAQVGIYGLCVRFELVAELEEGLGSWFAMDLSKIWVLKVGLLVVDTVRGGHLDC